jgi:putative ABC transport system permease protein
MSIAGAVRTALRALVRNALRSALAMLGIVIAVAAVVATVAIGDGAQAKMSAQMATLGANLLMITPGGMTRGGVSTGAGGYATLLREDGAAIEKELGDVVAGIAPVNRMGALVISGDVNWFTTLLGTTTTYLRVRDWALVEGDVWGREEEVSAGKVCLIGKTVSDKLFGSAPAVGATIRVKHMPCRIIGVLAAKGQGSFGQDQDDVVLMPWATLMRRLSGTAADAVGQFMVSAHRADLVPDAERQVTALLRQRHKLTEGVENDFQVRNLAEMQNAAQDQAKTISMLLGAVALISLIVGAIGIANVMLVSVTERTREIGIRMAIGATGLDVLMQFLIEAVVLSSVGGAAGLLLGIGVTQLVATQAEWPVLLSPSVMLGTLVAAGVSGIVAGFYPALRASRMDPIEALRYE